MRAAVLTLVLLAGLAAGARAEESEPPAETLRLLEEAATPLDQRDFEGRYRYAVRSLRTELDGSDAFETFERWELSRGPDGEVRRHVLEARRGEEDTTAERREQLAGEERPRRNGRATLAFPGTRTRASYRFAAEPSRDGRCASHFEPAGDDDGLLRGTVAWSCQTGEPLWIEGELAAPPMFVSELKLRFDFAVHLGFVFTRAWTIEGMGGPPFLKRRFKSEMELEELGPAAQDLPGP